MLGVDVAVRMTFAAGGPSWELLLQAGSGAEANTAAAVGRIAVAGASCSGAVRGACLVS